MDKSSENNFLFFVCLLLQIQKARDRMERITCLPLNEREHGTFHNYPVETECELGERNSPQGN